MRKRYWNRKVSALLMVGLVFSALPVHAFAEEEQKSVDVADSGMTTDNEKKDDTEAGTDSEAGEGKETGTEENTAEASEEKAEAASDVKPEVEELAEGILPEELTLASASDIPMTDTATEIEASLLGTWTVDGYTSLAFYGDGKGAMLLPAESYDFHYTLNDDHLDLDFVSSRARDLSYTISLDADTLQLSSGIGTKTVAIILQRVE